MAITPTYANKEFVDGVALPASDLNTYVSNSLAYLYANNIPTTLVTTRGDLIYRNATVPARLAIGASGTVLRSNGTDPAWVAIGATDLPTATTAAQGAIKIGNDLAIASGIVNLNKGTAFPGTPASGDLFWRTDFTPYRLYYYTGSAWSLLAGSVGVNVYNSTNLAVANTTATALTMDTEREDTDAMHSTVTNTSRLTCTVPGVYIITGALRFASASGGIRYAQIRLNGTTFIASNSLMASSADNHDLTVVRRYRLALNDYVEFVAYQNTGGSLNVGAALNFSPEFGMQWIGG